jgi:hypothetical protein
MFRRSSLLVAAMLAVSLVAAACDSAGPSANAGTTPGADASLPAATPGPTPTATPVDVSQAFLAQIVAATRGKLEITGTLELGSQIGDVTGTLAYTGSDSSQTTTITFAGKAATTATVHVGGVGWTKSGDSPWFVDAKPLTAGADLATVLKGLIALEDKGVEMHDGAMAHRIELPAGTVLPAAAFGLTDPKMISPTVDLAFYAADDGRPIAIVVNVTWTQTVNGNPMPVTMNLDFKYAQVGGFVTIAVPDDVWLHFTSTRYHYKLAYPDAWDAVTTNKGYDEFDSPTEMFFAASRYKTQGFSLNAIAKAVISYDRSHYKWTSNSNVAFTLGGTRARLLTFHATLDDGKKYVIYEVIAVKGVYWYDIVWKSLKGHEVDDLAYFKRILATYAYA